MENQQRQCSICQQYFYPNPRTGRQKICSRASCQKERKRREWRRWAARNTEQRKLKLRSWSCAYPHYWRCYRKTHPDYTARDNRRRCLSAKKSWRSAKQSLIKSMCAERLKAINNPGLSEKNSAKQTLIARQINDLVKYLIWRDCSAKHIHIGLAASLGA